MTKIGIIGIVLLFLSGCATQQPSPVKQQNEQELAKIYKDMGVAYMRRGEIERAQERLEKAVSISDQDAEVMYLLAEVYSRMNRHVEAEAHFRKALALNPNDPNLRNNFAAFLCSQEKYAEAEQIFIQVAADGTYATPYLALENAGRCALRNQEREKAEAYFAKALRQQAKLPNALYYMAELQYGKGEYFKARAFYERYLDVGGESPQQLLLGYQIESKLGDQVMAAKYADRLIQQYRDSEQTDILRKIQRDARTEQDATQIQ